MATRFILAVAAAVLLAPPLIPFCSAQRHSGGRLVPGGPTRHSATPYSHRRGGIPFGYFLGDAPYLFGDYLYGQPAPDSAPQLVTPPLLPAADTPSQPKPAPLLIELEGDRYVRYGGATRPEKDATQSGPLREAKTASDSMRSSSMPSAARQTDAAARTQLAPTVLVYRDGHREEIPDYAIVGRILYAHSGNNAQPGYGMRSIEVSVLDIPATVTANRENGINFVLPAGPNEVVTRP